MEYRIGDLVRYKYVRIADSLAAGSAPGPLAIIAGVNHEGGTLKVIDMNGQTSWFVTSYCEVVNEAI